MAALYRELDADLAGFAPICRGCGGCCRFDSAPHILYASDLEREYLLHTASFPGASGGDAELIARGLRCPFQVEGRCIAREGRVLGCRLHFCEGFGGEREQELCEAWHLRVKIIHAELGFDWRYRPLFPL